MKKGLSLMMILSVVIYFGLNSNPTEEEKYIVISWNDLGMHCSNKDFSKMAILPPYNTVYAQVIKVGSKSSMPEIVTDNIRVTYEFPKNTHYLGKTNFWDFEDKLFEKSLPDGVGLTGLGLTGEMTLVGNSFIAEGIPLTPYDDDDLSNEQPYQQALIKVYDNNGKILATSMPVVPVSNEIGCVSSGCHNSEQAILNKHENEGGFNPNNKPILCAKCHSSNALGTIGNSEAKSLSYRIHNQHSGITNDCYKCHPGKNAQCFRGVMSIAGKTCIDCHGNLSNVANSINSGRRPWLDEPSCDKSGCHSSNFAPNPGKLFKQSIGHGGLYCSACHGSPHAEYPTTEPRDNQNMIDLQGFEGKLSDCSVCHGYVPMSAGPHGVIPTGINNFALRANMRIYPNPAKDFINIENIGKFNHIKIFDLKGKEISNNHFRITIEPNKVVLSISSLSDGGYILMIDNFTEVVYKK